MPLFFAKEDIAEMAVDAIVNPTDEAYSGGGGTDRHIQKHAGPRLEEELDTLDILPVGEAKITGAYDLPSKYIIHTHGPIWEGGDKGEEDQLRACYQNCLKLAEENGCKSIAFPLISGGTYGFPNDDALRIQKESISEFLRFHDMAVYMVTYHRNTFNLGIKMFEEISDFISKRSIMIHHELDSSAPETAPLDLDTMLRNRGETFSCMLDRLREEKNMTGPELYQKAEVGKSVYSRIMNNMNYRPAKITAVAFGLALELPWDKFNELVQSAGYAMTRSSTFDAIIEYCVLNGTYDIAEINGQIYEHDPTVPLIGC